MSTVRATATGYDGTAVRNEGEVFTWPDTIKVKGKEEENPVPSWCEVVEAPQAQSKRKKAAGDSEPDAAALA